MNSGPAAIIELIAIPFVAALFVTSAYNKLRDLPSARYAVLDYQIVGSRLAIIVAFSLALAELTVATAVLVSPTHGLVAAAALCVLYALVVLSAVARKLDIECHCGPGSEAIGPTVVLRNLVLATVAVSVWLGAPSLSDDLAGVDPTNAVVAGTVVALVVLAVAVLGVRRQLVVPER